MKFANKILLLVLSFLLGTGILLSLFLYGAATKITEREIKARLHTHAVYGIDKINHLLFERTEDIHIIAKDLHIALNIKHEKNNDLFMIRLLHYLNTYKFYLSLSIYDENKVKIADTSNLNIGQVTADRIWVTRVYDEKKPSIAEDIFIDKKTSVMIFAAPILNDENKVLGAVVAKIDTDMIYQVLGQLDFRDKESEKNNVYVDLIDFHGLLLYSNYNTKNILKEKIDLNKLDHLRAHFYTYAHQKGYLDFTGNNWTLIVHLPIEKAFASITQLRNQAISIALILLLLVVIGVSAFSRRLILPIQSLENFAIQLGQGDFSVRAPILSRDEIGHLTRTFNQMAQLLEQQVNQLQEFKKIFDIGADMIFVFEANTAHFIYTNQAVAQQSGYESEVLLHLTPYDLLPIDRYSETKRLLDALIHQENSTHLYESEMLRKDGVRFPVEILVQYVQLNVQESHYIFVARDITERKQTERALKAAKEKAERANQTKTAFLSNMSHELRTPLNGILGYTQILKLDNDLSERQREGIDIIHRSGEYLLTMINDILDLSKIESDNLELHQSEFQLIKLLNNIVDLFKMRVQQKGIQFIFNLSEDLPQMVYADEARLRQALINILGSALKSMEEGEIRLEVYRTMAGTIRFTVHDTGLGISKQNIKMIFNPFNQLDARGFEVERAGLGLTIANKIIKLMQGKFTIESQIGQGSCFTIDLVLEEIRTTIAQPLPPTETIIGYQGQNFTIFIVDEEWESRQTLVEILLALEFTVHSFSQYREAVTQLEQIQPDVIIADLDLLIKCLKRGDLTITDIPLIVTTENIYEHQQDNLDYNALIAKPIHLEELFTQLQKVLNISWQYDKQHETKSESFTLRDCVLSQQKANIFYDLGRKGDIMGLIDEAEQLEQNPSLASLANQILQLAKDFDTDAICQLVEPFIEQT